MPQGVSTGRDLPVPPGSRAPGNTTKISIETVNNEDLFAGIYGNPKRITGLPGAMRYDPASGMVYNESRRKLPTYTVETDLNPPNAADLRSAGTDYRDIDPIYLQRNNISPKVVALAEQITAGHNTPFDKATALMRYFEGNSFTYRLQTATGSDADALEDFLFRSKAGFCEQYASAMAILARAAGLPSRVAIGYTAGYASGDYRSITTQDAHAWVEVYFPGQGWSLFDPTPLTDGRTYTPPYATATGSGGDLTDDPTTGANTPGSSTSAGPATNKEDRPDPSGGAPVSVQQQGGQPAWIGWTTGSLALLALLFSIVAALAAGGLLPGRFARRRRALIPVAVICWLLAIVLAAALVSWWLSALIVALTIAAAPGFVRQWQRRARRHAIHRNQPTAPSAAWEELLAESVDRGAEVIPAETVRTTARRLAREHDLDDEGKRALRTLVGAVERSWYGGRADPDPDLPHAFDDVVAGMRRSSPLALRARLLPRSVMRRLRR